MDTWLRWGLLSSVLAGSGIWLVYETLTKPRAPRRARNVVTGGELQVRYESAHFLMSWPEFLVRGGVYAFLFGLFGYLAVLNPVVIPPLAAFGFVYLYCAEEDRRDRQMMDYNGELAQSATYMMTAFEGKGSIGDAIAITAEYATGGVKDDMNAIVAGRGANIPLENTLAEISARRNSLFLDGFFEAIKAADKMNPADIVAILEDQSRVIVQGVEAFRDHLVKITEVRRQVLWATFGPWLVAGAGRWLALLTTPSSGKIGVSELGDFYVSPIGTIFLLVGACLSIFAYWQMTRTMRSGIVLGRIPVRARTQPTAEQKRGGRR